MLLIYDSGTEDVSLHFQFLLLFFLFCFLSIFCMFIVFFLFEEKSLLVLVLVFLSTCCCCPVVGNAISFTMESLISLYHSFILSYFGLLKNSPFPGYFYSFVLRFFLLFCRNFQEPNILLVVFFLRSLFFFFFFKVAKKKKGKKKKKNFLCCQPTDFNHESLLFIFFFKFLSQSPVCC